MNPAVPTKMFKKLIGLHPRRWSPVFLLFHGLAGAQSLGELPEETPLAVSSLGTISLADLKEYANALSLPSRDFAPLLISDVEGEREQAAIDATRLVYEIATLRNLIAEDQITTATISMAEIIPCLKGRYASRLSTTIDLEEPMLRGGFEQLRNSPSNVSCLETRVIYRKCDLADAVCFESNDKLLNNVRELIVSRQDSFPNAARQFSNLASGAEGGSMGCVKPSDSISGRIRAVIEGLKDGEISPVIRLKNGVYLFTVESRRVSIPDTFEETMNNPLLNKKVRGEALSIAIDSKWKALLANVQQAGSLVGVAALDRMEVSTIGSIEQCAGQLLLAKAVDRLSTKISSRINRDEVLSDVAMETYYKSNPNEFMSEGIFKLMIVGHPGYNRKGQRLARIDQLNQLRQLLSNYKAEVEINNFEQLLPGNSDFQANIVLTDWVRGTGSSQADSELLGLNMYHATNPYSSKDGTMLAVLLDRRTPNIAPMDGFRDYIIQALLSGEMSRQYDVEFAKARQRFNISFTEIAYQLGLDKTPPK